MSECRWSTTCAVVERPDLHCRDDLVSYDWGFCLLEYTVNVSRSISQFAARLLLPVRDNKQQANTTFRMSTIMSTDEDVRQPHE